ncbi:MAG TPA: oxidoreductase [Candidatus Hypogeohydataceae bacterium YC41]
MISLFDKANIGPLELKNRLIMTAMDVGFSTDGFINDRFIDFYAERARGGVSLIIIGGCYPHESGKHWKSILGLDEDLYIPSLKRFTEAMHQLGAKTATQLLHGGRYASSLFTKRQPVSASSVPSRLAKDIPRPLTIPEIKEIINSYARAAFRAREAGFDAVEIHGGMGYLINQFLSPITNQRKDEYGGDLQGRLRFAREVVQATRELVEKDFPIIFRLAGDELMMGGNRIKENIEIARELARVGVDAFHVSPGWHESKTPIMVMAIPRMAYTFLAASIKENVNLPVIAGVRINDLSVAEEFLRDGQADFIAIGRPLIADPELPKKYREGTWEDIRTCIACNQGCFDELLNMKPISCLYNPQVGHEREYIIKEAPVKKRVMIVGGGPGGMEAARVAALRGHQVALYEKDCYLGGQLHYAYKPPGRGEFQHVISYLERQILKLGVSVNLGIKVDTELIKKEQPQVVILSTGSLPIIPPILGVNGKNVVLARDVLERRVPVGNPVAIIGGGSVGCEVALYVAKLGSMSPEVALFLLKHQIIDLATALQRTLRGHRKVTVLEMKKRLGSGFGLSTRWVILQEMEETGIETLTGVKVKEIKESASGGPGGILYEKEGRGGSDPATFLPAETIILATGYMPNNSLYQQMDSLVPEMYAIGDCVKVRTAMEAIHEGFKISLNI